jgi:hypothetical protein
VSFTDSELDAAVTAISEPGRLNAAQDVVSRLAPGLQKLLAGALHEGGWFDTAHEAAIKDAIAVEDPHQRLTAIRTLLAEETRLSMLVGVAVGFELARELGYAGEGTAPDTTDRKD